MSRALRARTHRGFYLVWEHQAREGGITEAEIDAAIEGQIREAQSLLDGKCPRCGALVARYVDYEQQQGPSKVPGAWVMYRCSTQPPPGQLRIEGRCDFGIDLKEGEAAN